MALCLKLNDLKTLNSLAYNISTAGGVSRYASHAAIALSPEKIFKYEVESFEASPILPGLYQTAVIDIETRPTVGAKID